MKSLLTTAILIITLNGCANTPTKHKTVLPDPPIQGAVWKQTFDDEFNGTAINPDHWIIRHENRSPRPNNFWNRDCAKLDGKGHLRMITRKSLDKPDWYDTACITTQGKFTQRFGYFEIRAEMQTQPGFWSAFWAMPAPSSKVFSTKYEGMDGTELDIFEKHTLDDEVQQTLHWDGYKEHHKTDLACPIIPGIMNGFHTFALLWTPDEYVFYIDGKETWRTSAGGVMQVPLNLRISAEIGDWAGDITKANLPDEFRVDYVRVWQLYDKDGSIAFTPKPFTEAPKD